MQGNKLLVTAVLAAVIAAPIVGFVVDSRGQSMPPTEVRLPFLHGRDGSPRICLQLARLRFPLRPDAMETG